MIEKQNMVPNLWFLFEPAFHRRVPDICGSLEKHWRSISESIHGNLALLSPCPTLTEGQLHSCALFQIPTKFFGLRAMLSQACKVFLKMTKLSWVGFLWGWWRTVYTREWWNALPIVVIKWQSESPETSEDMLKVQQAAAPLLNIIHYMCPACDSENGCFQK